METYIWLTSINSKRTTTPRSQCANTLCGEKDGAGRECRMFCRNTNVPPTTGIYDRLRADASLSTGAVCRSIIRGYAIGGSEAPIS
jgi:hypothetical protein